MVNRKINGMVQYVICSCFKSEYFTNVKEDAMPAPKTTFIQYSCFGYYDEKFDECLKKCRHSKACKKATKSDDCEEVRKIFKYKKSQINELVEKYGG